MKWINATDKLPPTDTNKYIRYGSIMAIGIYRSHQAPYWQSGWYFYGGMDIPEDVAEVIEWLDESPPALPVATVEEALTNTLFMTGGNTDAEKDLFALGFKAAWELNRNTGNSMEEVLKQEFIKEDNTIIDRWEETKELGIVQTIYRAMKAWASLQQATQSPVSIEELEAKGKEIERLKNNWKSCEEARHTHSEKARELLEQLSTKEEAIKELLAGLESLSKAADGCYDATEWPANGTSNIELENESAKSLIQKHNNG